MGCMGGGRQMGSGWELVDEVGGGWQMGTGEWSVRSGWGVGDGW